MVLLYFWSWSLAWFLYLPLRLAYLHWCAYCCSSGWSVNISPAERRRLRRQRSEARFRLWLHRQGLRPLTLTQLLTFRHRLSQHHSRDLAHLSFAKQTIAKQSAAMTEASKDPWRCGPCRRLVKAAISFCPNCGGHWMDIADEDYVHGQARKSQSSKGWEWNQWTDWSGSQSRTTSPRMRSQSQRARRGRKGKGKSKGKSTETDVPGGATSFPSLPSPFTPGGSYAVTTTAPPWTSEKSMDQPSLNQELIQAVRKAFPDSASVAAGIEGYPGQDGEHRDEEDHIRPPQVYSGTWACAQAASRAAGSQVAAQSEVGAALECFAGRLAEADRKLRQTAGAVQYVDPTSDHRIALCSELDSAAQCKSCSRSQPRVSPRGSPNRKSRSCVGGRGGEEAQGEDAGDHRESSQSCGGAGNRSGGCRRISSGEAPKVQRTTTVWRKWRGCNHDYWFFMRGGSIVSCLRKVQCGPLPCHKTVVFSDVEAYGIDCRAACMPDPAVLVCSPAMHSVIYEDDCIFDFEAIGCAQLLHGEVIAGEAEADLASQQISSTLCDDLQLVGRWQTHVFDRWCSVNGSKGLITTVPDGTCSSGSIEWRFPPAPTLELAQHFGEALFDESERALVAFSCAWAGNPDLKIRTYGYFAGYQGTRDALISIDRVHLIAMELEHTWHDFVQLGRVSYTQVHPQPSHNGVDIHLIVHDTDPSARVLLLLEIPNGDARERAVVNSQPDDSGFSVLIRAGHVLVHDARYTMWHDGRAHYGHGRLAGVHGQFWKASISRSVEEDVISLFSVAVCHNQDGQVPTCQYRPNPDVRIPFDDDLPIVRRTAHGTEFAGRVIPPPNWAESTLYRAASSAGACFRNSQGDLLVRVRTWVIEHVDGGRYAPRDFTMRAQLLVRLREKIKRVWQDVIGRDDHLGIHIVRPAPFADPDGSRYLPILAEANRPRRCQLQPVLFAVREITALGVDPPDWCACLVPAVFSVADVHAACQPAGEPYQMLVPLGGQQQQWMSARHTRVATVGLFVPVWWDDRLPPPEDDRDVNSLFQFRFPVAEEDDSAWLMQWPKPSISPNLGPVRLYGLKSAIATVTLDGSSPIFEQLEQAWPVHLRDFADLHALHYVASPPTFVNTQPDATYLMRFHDDHFSQVNEDDILALVSIIMETPERKQRLKVQWAPRRASRNSLLEYLRLGWFCQQADVLCFTYLNEVFWPLEDNSVRHLENGDSLKFLIRSERYTWCDIAHAERISRLRRFFESSDEEAVVDTEGVQGPDKEASSHARSRSRDRTRYEDSADSYSLLQRSARRVSSQTAGPNVELNLLDTLPDGADGLSERPHVSDLWCAQYESPADPSRPDKLILDGLIPSRSFAGWQEIVDNCRLLTDPPEVIKLRDALCSLGSWNETCFCNDWSIIPEAHPYVQLVKKFQPVAGPVGAYHVFVDGSYYPSTEKGAWAFEVVLQLKQGDYYRWGYTGAPVDGSASSLKSEALGAIAALHWIVTTVVGGARPVTLYCDANCIGLGLAGSQRLPTIDGLCRHRCRAFFQLAKALLPSLQYQHVKAHAGQLDNEVVDSVAKALALQDWSPFLGIPDFLQCMETPLWEWAWLLIETEINLNTELPLLPELLSRRAYDPVPCTPCEVFTQVEECCSGVPLFAIDLQMATANVCSLKEKDAGFYGKASLLAEQFARADFEVVGLQETRARVSTVLVTNGFVRFVAASDSGHGGVELWFSQSGSVAKSAFGPVTPGHCKVWHSSSTILWLECDHPILDCDFVVIYAPQAAREKDDIAVWWQQLEGLFSLRKGREIVLLGDYNAKLGAVVTESIGDHHWCCEDTAGEFARSLLTTSGLFLPSTFEHWQVGSSETYHSHTGSGTRVDYVAVPLQWQNGVQEAYVSTVDLLSGDYDHSPAVVKLSLQVKPASSVTRPSRAAYNREAAIAAPTLLARIVDTLPAIDAQVDVDSHWQVIESHCRSQLQRRFPKGKRVLRQHYFSDATWQLLQDRKDLAIQIKDLDFEEELGALRIYFAAWKAAIGKDSGPYIETSLGLVRQEKAVALWAIRILRGKFQASRKNDLLHHEATVELSFLDGVTSTSAQKLYKALRPKRPVNRSKGFKVPKPLPTLDSDAHCRYRGRLVKVWEKHFSKIETADYYDTTSYVQEARPFVQPPLLQNFELGVIPTRAEFEDALRQLSSRKAPGYDGIGAELWKSDPSVASGRLYPLFLKSVARGYIPLQFRGGFLVPLYKNKGPADDAASYRGILLQNTAAKIFAKSWRMRLVSKFGLSAPPMLCGCMKRRGVDSAHLAVRLHQNSAHVRQHASAIIFIDIKAAYYSVVKELFYDTTAPDGLRAVTLLFNRLKLPESALEDFVSTISSTNLLEDASVHEVLQK